MNPTGKDPALEPALRDIESIQSLDTARLALRWALERMRTVERRLSEAEDESKRSEDARARTVSELDAARELLARRAAEAMERERYYMKVEEYLSLRLGGGLDAAALAKRETRLEEREADLQRREIETERKLKASKLRYDEDLRRELADAASAADARVKEVQEEADRRAAARERDFSERVLSLHEKQAHLAALERSLEERRKRFEEFFAAQRAAMERESSAIGQAASDQAEFVERRVEQALAAKTKAFEAAWQADKHILIEELADWRRKAREHLPAMLEAQRKAAAVEDERRRLAEENNILRQAKSDLTEELVCWRARAQDVLPAQLSAARRAAEAEEKARCLEAELAAVQRRSEESLAELMSLEMSQESRVQELERLESLLAAKLRHAESNLLRQYDVWLQREEELRRRDQDWQLESEARFESVEALRADITAQREELKRAIAVYRAKTEDVLRAEGR